MKTMGMSMAIVIGFWLVMASGATIIWSLRYGILNFGTISLSGLTIGAIVFLYVLFRKKHSSS
jgi:hypothetical protein